MKTIIERFEEKIKKTDSCWIWTSTISKNNGYGQFKLNNRTMSAHRVAYELYNSLIPKDLCVLHKCDNTICVNPKHLFLGTKNDNNLDRAKKNRSFKPKGEKHPMVKLTKEQVLEIRQNYKGIPGEYKEIAKKYGISRSHVGGIINKIYWKELI